MAALVGGIDDPHARIEILHSLVEEHGEFDETVFHHNTFRRFLETLGTPADRLEALAVVPPVRAFNSVLSALIGRAVVHRGFIPAERLVHYRLHAKIDERHAKEFFAVIEARWTDPARRYYIEQGLDLVAYVFNRLYLDLHAMTREPGTR